MAVTSGVWLRGEMQQGCNLSTHKGENQRHVRQGLTDTTSSVSAFAAASTCNVCDMRAMLRQTLSASIYGCRRARPHAHEILCLRR